ncbi:GspE/PulE family protein [Thiorhodovibrio frisius]|uniref:Type II secretory pathway, ATPase PulE/Tfp pilus assembly pathway, ATPase PilB n=1 Tax=Thiorhodovibrio frisius TaxID=631362 RepID=H8Z3F9_9GAMM|nr:GspE/PulE family protein [Thiorhodovibrio frisius]EIC21867.1 type II secretory pathway, ATPase PulE/Tfp pilus assembly pathway, ATPase PilB [Thiorhodovibrio frisius]WPL24156.1 Type II traffic warden ATPase [Thiorhodovibrio frisius]
MNAELQGDDEQGSGAPPPAPMPQAATPSAEIARLLIEAGAVSPEQINHAMRVRSKLGEDFSLTRVLTELGYLSSDRLRAALRDQGARIHLGDVMVELGYLKPRDLRAALEAQSEPEYQGKRLGEILLDMGLISEQRLIEVLADQLDFLVESPNFSQVDQELLKLVTPDWCRRLAAMPLRREAEGVLVAFTDPLDSAARHGADAAFGRVVPVIATRRALDETIRSYEASRQHAKQRKSETNESDVTRQVDSLILNALDKGASDIHIEPMRHMLRVRYRIDGVLMQVWEIDRELAPAIASRLKVLAKADIAERRRHQDGGFRFDDPVSGRRCDVRASFYATVFGEKIVLRLLSRKAELLDIDASGIAPRMLERFNDHALELPSGVILVTGPTGSGKTTTLYGCVNKLNDMETSIATAEDPVEYVIDGIAQCSVNPKINLTFAETLRALVRQDPDVIVLGEIRDKFSAESAIQAALTGHKVLSTFHTEDSIGALLRLMNMDIETFLISSTVVAVLAQRLLRKVCDRCSEGYQPTPHDLQRIGWTQADAAGGQFRLGRGCRYCNFTGYAGRVGVFELLLPNDGVKDAVLNRRSSGEIRRISIETAGLVSLMEDGLAKAAQGMTTIKEVLGHLPRIGRPRSYREVVAMVGAVKI